ncbi:MAG: ATP-binding protein, partial [Oscillospiraceae bacterium]
AYYLDFCRNIDYRQTVEEALNDNSSSCIIKINDVNYRIHASNVKLDWGNMAVFIFINDITEEEKSQEMRRQFTANVSHELKTPLASIIGTAEIIKDGIVKQEDIPHFAQKIYEDAQRLLSLVQNIIKLSRLDEGNLSLELSTIELSDLCNQVKSELLDKAKSNNIDINVECDTLYISAYPTTLHEMIYNLCDNAITYNKENGRVNISVKKENDSALLSISDTGIGIAKENIPHIFERFYCVDKSHSKKKGGTGLGLSIVKHAAKMNNAEISIESELDVGTTIKVKFPLQEKSL